MTYKFKKNEQNKNKKKHNKGQGRAGSGKHLKDQRRIGETEERENHYIEKLELKK